jgi:catechol 2,3-dioxygenase-like lactoylglutathione lyase family enzyme
MTACPTPLPGTIHRAAAAPTRRACVHLAGLARIVLRVRDLRTSLRFFGGTLGLPVSVSGRRTFIRAGGSELELREEPGMAICGAASTDVFTLGCGNLAELNRAAGLLAAARVPNTGVMQDAAGKHFVRFTDPDGRVFELIV